MSTASNPSSSRITAAVSWVLIELTEFYQSVISPVLPGNCRFHPTCSAYAAKAVKRHGPIHGTVLAFRRILRCNPWGPFGDDPVPPLTKHADHAGPCHCDETMDDRKNAR